LRTDPVPDGITILHLDGQLCAALKPAGMPVQPDPTGDASLLELLSRQLADQALGLVHRLDRPVSGVVLFARDAATLAALNEHFRERRVEKRYWAIVEGRAENGVATHHLAHDAKAHRARVLPAGAATGEPARLRMTVLAHGDRYTLLEAVPEGGAFHQIRAQLAAMGHPIKGDVKYGARRGEKDRSIALHARSVRFQHPATGGTLTIEAPTPEGPLWGALLAAAARGGGS